MSSSTPVIHLDSRLPALLSLVVRPVAVTQLDHPERQPVSCPRGPRLQLRQCGGRWRDVDPRCAGFSTQTHTGRPS